MTLTIKPLYNVESVSLEELEFSVIRNISTPLQQALAYAQCLTLEGNGYPLRVISGLMSDAIGLLEQGI